MMSERILVSGPAHRVAIVGAYLARRWAGAGRELVLAPENGAPTSPTILARPDHLNFHTELGLSPEQVMQATGAEPVFAATFASPDGDVVLPFSVFGAPRFGLDFHHFWKRAALMQDQPEFERFSPALGLHHSQAKPRASALPKLGLAFGLEMDAAHYANLLIEVARSNGAQVIAAQSADDVEYDLLISCAAGPNDSAGWENDILTLGQTEEFPGIEWQVCVNAARRVASLSARLSQREFEQREYNRLADAESDRIEDMRELLNAPDPSASKRPSLARKVAVFQASGRVPAEDFEIFMRPEWIAALWARNIQPSRYDRMAEAMPENELHQWLVMLEEQVSQLPKAVGAE